MRAGLAEEGEGREGVLREQMEAAMRKLRAYAREVEQNMESVRSPSLDCLCYL